MPRGSGARTRTGMRLNLWLRTVGEGTSAGFLESLQELKEEGLSIGNLKTVMTFFWVLKARLGLIEVARLEIDAKRHTRHYYRLREGYERDMAWMDVYKYAYPDDYANARIQKIYWKIRNANDGRSVTPDIYDRERHKYA